MLLRHLVALDHLDLRLCACEEGLDRRIRWVHTTELIDPSQYLEGGELILTTGLWRRRLDDEERFVSALAGCGVYGLVYGLPKPGAHMPEQLVEACRRHGLPLLEASFELPFIAISKAVVAGLTAERQAVLLRTIHRNEELVDAVGSGEGASGVLRLLARDHALAPWLLGPGGRVLAEGSRLPAPEEIAAVRAAVAAERSLPADAAGGRGSVFAVIALGHADAHLVLRKGLAQLTAEERTAVDQALAFLALEFARLHAIRAMEARFARELLDLASAGEARAAEAATRLRALGLDTSQPLLAVVLSATAGEAELERLAELAESFFAEREVSAVVPTAEGQAIAILNWPEQDLRRLGGELRDALGRELPTADIAVGVGSPARSVGELRRSLIEARHACRLARLRRQGPRVATYDEIGSHALLLALQEEEVRSSFRAAVLAPVLDYDLRRETELVRTLEVFLSTGGQWRRTADLLNVHVNTLRHRLARLEALTGRDLSTMEDRVDFYLALQADSGPRPELE